MSINTPSTTKITDPPMIALSRGKRRISGLGSTDANTILGSSTDIFTVLPCPSVGCVHRPSNIIGDASRQFERYRFRDVYQCDWDDRSCTIVVPNEETGQFLVDSESLYLNP